MLTLRNGVQEHGEDWQTIHSKLLTNHTPRQLEYCWTHKLRPGAQSVPLPLPSAPPVFGGPPPELLVVGAVPATAEPGGAGPSGSAPAPMLEIEGPNEVEELTDSDDD